jgi:hypothetical protein
MKIENPKKPNTLSNANNMTDINNPLLLLRGHLKMFFILLLAALSRLRETTLGKAKIIPATI